MNELVTKMHILLKGRVLMTNLERLTILLLCREMNLHDPLLILVHLSKIYILSSVYRTFLAQ